MHSCHLFLKIRFFKIFINKISCNVIIRVKYFVKIHRLYNDEFMAYIRLILSSILRLSSKDICLRYTIFSREVAGNFSNSNIETQPPMMSFKAFLGTQEDTITDEEAIKRYNEYKLEFKRQQLNEFFVAHKDEEWYIFIFTFFSFLRVSGVASLSIQEWTILSWHFLTNDEIDFFDCN